MSYSSVFAAKSVVIDIDYNYDVDQNWLKLALTEKESIKKLLYLLKRSSTGAKIILKAQAKAAKMGKTLLDVIAAGEISLCDTTLTRKFFPKNPDKTIYISSSKVYLNKNLVVADAVLDLVHELTHFTYRTPFNPYRLSFTLEQFIKSTVEGSGGEVEAYMVECNVLDQLFHKQGAARDYCDEIKNSVSGKISKKLGMEQFYKIGSYYNPFFKELTNFGIRKRDFPSITDELSLFISSAYGVPYPVAAYKEFINIMERSCENDLKRLAIMKQRTGRKPASGGSQKLFKRMKRGYQKRCMNLFVDHL